MLKPLKITWVNHAGYVISYDNINVLVDPWISGTSFNNGWNLLTKSFFPNNLNEKIDYLWISHEHPDHFSTNTLKILNKKKVKVIFQKTKDKRVVNYLNKLGFKVIELDNYKKFSISQNFKVTIIKNDQIDSLSIFELGDKKIINTNDCVLDQNKLDQIKKKILIKKFDILLTQFSYASWIGNAETKFLRKKASLEKIRQMKNQIKCFKPKVTIPFASYIYFCHEENKYMNDEITNIDEVKNCIEKNQSLPIFLYPGSTFEIDKNIKNYKKDFLKYKKNFLDINSNQFIKTIKINFTELEYNSKNYIKKIKKKNGYLSIFICTLLSNLSNFIFNRDLFGFSETKIYLFDIDKYVEFNLLKGLKLLDNSRAPDCDVEISSDSLNYIFLYDWGIGSLMINGRGKYTSEYKKWKFNRVFSLGQINSIGTTLFKKILEKFIKKILLKKSTHLENYESSFLRKLK